MSWAKLDDRANEHRKQLEAGADACWLWACGLMYANRQDARDGFIPERMLGMLYPFEADPKVLAAKLVEVKLWERVPGGYFVHNYHRWNPTKEQREAELSSGRERAARSYSLRAKTQKSSGEEPPKKQDSSGPSPLRLHSDSKPLENSDARERAEPAATAPAVRGLVPKRPRAPTNQPDALALPIAERARLVLEDPANGAWSSPQSWPEVVGVAEALAKAAGQARPRLGDCSRDAGVKTVLGLLADGWNPEELRTLAGAIGRSQWWRSGSSPRGLSSLTPEVLRRAQNERPRVTNVDPETARELAKTARMRAEYAREQASETHDLRTITAQIGNGGQ